MSWVSIRHRAALPMVLVALAVFIATIWPGTTAAAGAAPAAVNPEPGGVFNFGDASPYGWVGIPRLHATPIVGMAATRLGRGYWEVDARGDVFAYGNARSYGSLRNHPVNRPISGITATPDGQGYWLVARDGGVFSFGDARFHGSMGGRRLNAPVVGMVATPDGRGYWLAAADGGVFAFGDARFEGSLAGKALNAPVVGMAATPDGRGYWLAAADGGVFTFGDAAFFGSAGGTHLNAAVSGIAASPDGRGYWLVARDGGVFTYGNAAYAGSAGSVPIATPIVGIAATPDGNGYWLVSSTVATGACSPSQLRLTLRSAVGGSGHLGEIWALTNVSAGTCALFGYPGVSAVGQRGQVVANAKRQAGPSALYATIPERTVPLLPGDSAEFWTAHTVPSASARSCALTTSIVVTPPNDRASLDYALATRICGSDFEVSPVGTTVTVVPRTGLP